MVGEDLDEGSKEASQQKPEQTAEDDRRTIEGR